MSIGSQPVAAAPVASQYGTGVFGVTQSLFVYDNAIAVAFSGLREGVAFSDLASASLTHALNDALAWADTAASLMSFNVAAADAFLASTSIGLVWQEILTSPIVFTTAPQALALVLYSLTERVIAADATVSVLDALTAVLSAIILEAAAATLQLSTSADVVAIAPVVAAAIESLNTALTTAVFADASTPQAVFIATWLDSLAASDTLSSAAKFIAALADGVAITMVVTFGAEEYFGFILNPFTETASTYVNYPFQSFAQFNDAYYGAADTGLYVLSGDTDAGAPISAIMRTGLTALGNTMLKRVPVAYVGYTSDGQLVMKVTTTSPDGAKVQYWYGLEPRPVSGAVTNNRVKIDRGPRSTYWQFELVNVAGANFTIDELALFPMVLERRV